MKSICTACNVERGRYQVQVEVGDGLDNRHRERKMYRIVTLCKDCADLFYQGTVTWDPDHGWVRNE